MMLPAVFSFALALGSDPQTPECRPATAALAGVGRAAVVAFTGAVYGEPVCSVVANLRADQVEAAIDPVEPAGALVSAALGPGGAGLSVRGGTLSMSADAPFLIAPGGTFVAPADADQRARVVLAYAGPRIVLVATSPVALLDLERELREQPDLFGIDPPERAVVLASGPSATLLIPLAGGDFGTVPDTAQRLVLMKRG